MAIEVKMNFEQFRKSLTDPQTLIDKLAAFRIAHPGSRCIVVVIQGSVACRPHHRLTAMRAFEQGSFPIELVCYDEDSDSVRWSTVGGDT